MVGCPANLVTNRRWGDLARVTMLAMQQAQEGIARTTVVLLAAMIPLSTAMERPGDRQPHRRRCVTSG
jgi:hypothetical protein